MSRIDTAARGLLEEFEIAAPPVDVHAIAQLMGVHVVQTPMAGDVSGMLIRDDGVLTVGLNSHQAARRQRFTLAHELGHLRLHRGRPLIVDSSMRINLRDSTSATATDREEMEANRFAAELLMPEHMIRDALASAASAKPSVLQRDLAQLFDVSTEAMGYRLINLGIAT